MAYTSLLLENDRIFAKIAKNIVFLPYELIFQLFEKKTTPGYLTRHQKLVLVLKSGSHRENASVAPVCNPWPIQL